MPREIRYAELDLMGALDLAILIEQEAEERYQELAEQVGGRYDGDASHIFELMAANEAKHARQLSKRRMELFGETPRELEPSQLFDEEAPQFGDVRVYMSPRQALEVALASEIKAHEFYDRALDQVENTEVRALFEELRDEEARHRSLLEKRLVDYPPGPDIEAENADEPPAL